MYFGSIYLSLHYHCIFLSSILSYILHTVTSWISTYGYPGAFFAALLETIFPPIPSELIFSLIGFTEQTKGLGSENALGMAIVGALGSIGCSIAIYFIALKLGKTVFLKLKKYMRIGESELHKSEKRFETMELSLFFQEEWHLEFVKLFPFPQVLVK